MKHLPIESGMKPPCGSKRALLFVEPGEAPTCVNCRRIADRRALFAKRTRGAKPEQARRYSDDRVREMVEIWPARYGREILVAARERAMPMDHRTGEFNAVLWLRAQLNMPLIKRSVGW